MAVHVNSGVSSNYPAYRPDVDGLRAVAVLSVVVYHAAPKLLPSGFIGVDVFFVISGYLISSIIIKSAVQGTFSFTDFYARRIKRIAPALLLVLVACLLFGWFGLLADEYRQLGGHVQAGIGFISNIVFWSESGYFDSASEAKPLLHLWSLAIEEQFYVVWPIIVVFVVARRYNLLLTIVCLLAGSFVLNVAQIKHDQVATFYSPFSRGWELLVGAALAYVTLHNNHMAIWARHNATIVSALGVAMLAAGFLLITDEMKFPGWWAVLPVLGAVLLIASGPQALFNKVVLSNPLFVWFGLISFPLYLWHWPLLSLPVISIGSTPPFYFRAAAILVSILLAWLTYRYVEKPIRQARPGWPGVRFLITCMLVVGLVGMLISANQGFYQRTAVKRSDFTPRVAEQFMGALWKYSTNEECLTRYPFEESKSYRWWFCMLSSAESPTIALIGNSFANQLYPGFVKNPAFVHHSILSIGTCDASEEVTYFEDGSNPCYGERQISQTRFVEGVLASTESLQYVILDGFELDPDEPYIQRTIDRVGQLLEIGLTVIVFKPHLLPERDPKSCFTMPLRRVPADCTIPQQRYDELNRTFQPLIGALSKAHPEVLFFDQNVVFCDGAMCSGVRKGMPMHRDNTHLSEFASVLLQEYFTDWAKVEVPEIFEH